MRWQRAAVIAAMVAACGGGSSEQHHSIYLVDDATLNARTTAATRLMAAVNSHDPGAITAVLSDEVAYGGLWFADSECQRTFAVTGQLRGDALAAFARCLAPLTLERGEGAHPYPNVLVFQYDPGIEVEVLFDLASSKVRWIGYAERRENDALPEVTASALLAHRVEPATNELDPAVFAAVTATHSPRASAWLKLCIDATGALTGVHPYFASSFEARDAFVAMVRTWKFQAFVLGDQPSPVCSLVFVEQPASTNAKAMFPPPVPASHPDAIYVPAISLGELVAGTRLLIPSPDDMTAISHAHLEKLTSQVNFCLSADGKVDWVLLVTQTPFANYNATLTDGVRRWQYKPPPEPVCATALFSYSQR